MKYYVHTFFSRTRYFNGRDDSKFQIFRTIHDVWGEINEYGKVRVYDKSTSATCKKYADNRTYVEVDPLWPHYPIIIPD
jgi:hypothetical protein